MEISAGLAGMRAAAELVRMLREGLKNGAVTQDQLAGRIGEIYDYIIDSKAALIDAKDEIDQLKGALKSFKDTQLLGDSLEFDGKVYWIAKSEKWDGPFCQRCWDDNKKLVRLDHQRIYHDDPKMLGFWCPIDRRNTTTKDRPNVIPDLPAVRRI